METQQSKSKIKFGTIINILCIAGIAGVFEYAINFSWSTALLIAESVLSMILIFSLYFSMIKTGLWSFTHRPINKLDEREIGLVHLSLQYGYSVFSIIVLAVLVISSVFEYSISIVSTAMLILFAHLVPASIIIWKEKSI